MPLTPLQTAFSEARLGRYLEWASGNPATAVQLYTLNAKLSEALYIPLQALELSLRNRIHDAMRQQFGEEWLLDGSPCLHEKQMQKVRRALVELTLNRKAHTSEQVLSTLSFGFWTALLGTEYEALWRKTLYQIASKPNGKRVPRKSLSGPLTRSPPSASCATGSPTMSRSCITICRGTTMTFSKSSAGCRPRLHNGARDATASQRSIRQIPASCPLRPETACLK